MTGRSRFLIGLAGAVILLGLGWRAYTVAGFYWRLAELVTKRGGVVRRGGFEPGFLRSTVRDVRVELDSEVSVSIARLDVTHPLSGSISGVARGVHVSLRGAPTALWEHWRDFPELPVEFTEVAVDYRDSSVGRISTTNTKTTRSESEIQVQASALKWNQTLWNQVSFTISRPQTAIRIGLPEDQGKALTLTYVRRRDGVGEWAFDIPNQALNPLAKRFGLDALVLRSESRVSALASLLVSDDATRPRRGQLRFVVDDWFRPTWPEAAFLVGRSGAVGARMETQGDGASFTLSRVEVTASIFSLTGFGRLTLGPDPELVFDARGSLTCAKLAANLPPSVYRERVRNYLKPSRDEETVTLRLAFRLTRSSTASSVARWHLTSGCGLAELSDDATGSGQNSPRTTPVPRLL